MPSVRVAAIAMIHGLSDKRRLPRLGKIKLGVLVVEGKKSYPKAVDYFVVSEAVAKVHGERPRALPIMFPVDDPSVLFPQAYKMYKRSGLYCAGDGEVARRWDAGELKERACPCEFLDSGECKAVATLNVLLPDVPGLGVWQISTSSERSIVGLNSSLENFSTAFGGLRGIPFTLLLEEEQTQRWDERQGAMVKQVVHVLRLDTPHTLNEILRWRRALGKHVEALMPAPEADDDERAALAAGTQMSSHDPGTDASSPAGGAHPEHDHRNAIEPASGTPKRRDDQAPCVSAGAQSPAGPLTVLPPSGAPLLPDPHVQAEPDLPAGQSAAQRDDPFDVSMCFHEAKRCGISPELYTRYLAAAYKTDPDNITPAQLAQEERQFAAAQTETARTLHKAEVVRMVNEALKKRSPSATPMTMGRRRRC